MYKRSHTTETAPLIGLSWARVRALGQPVLEDDPPASLRPRLGKRSRRWVWLRRLLLVAMLLGVLIFGLQFLFSAAYFQIQHLSIENTQNAQLIASIRRLHLAGGNIFLAATDQDEARIKALPPVADAHVTRSLPDTLVITIVERQPVLIWQSGDQNYSLDAGGAIIALVQPPPGGLPVVSDEHQLDATGKPFAPGGKIERSSVEMARQLLERLPIEVGITNFSVRDTIEYGLVVLSADGWQARFGGPENLNNKIVELAAILHLVKQHQQQLALVDLRFGFYPYYRLTSPASGA